MWPFKKNIESIQDSGVLTGITDWHSHVLPGVDDGIQSIEDSLAVLRHFDTIGVDTLWLTPHIMEDYPNTTEGLKKKFETLRQVWDGKVKLHLASENMLDSLFEQRLETRDFLPIGKNADHLLVETSYFSAPMGFENIIDSIMKAGYFPLLAHPERYRYMSEDDYTRLHDKGVKMQMNYVSLVGGYGESAQKKAIWLLKKGYINLIGSDIHRLSSNQSLITKNFEKKEHLDLLRNLVNDKNEL